MRVDGEALNTPSCGPLVAVKMVTLPCGSNCAGRPPRIGIPSPSWSCKGNIRLGNTCDKFVTSIKAQSRVKLRWLLGKLRNEGTTGNKTCICVVAAARLVLPLETKSGIVELPMRVIIEEASFAYVADVLERLPSSGKSTEKTKSKSDVVSVSEVSLSVEDS